MSIRFRSLRRHAAFVALVAATSCAVPTEPRWERAGDVPIAPAESNVAVARYTIESAPVVAATEFRSRVLPAVETVLAAPAAGRTVGRLVGIGDAVEEGQPLLEWTTEVDDTTRLRIEILERSIELAELEGRGVDAALVRDELAEVRAIAAQENAEVIVSPVAGVVGRYLTDRSVDFAEGDDLLTVGDPSTTRVDIALTVDAATTLTVGSTLRVVDAQHRFGEPTPAVVTEVRLPANRSSDAEVTAELDEGSTLPVGARVIVDVDRRSDQAGRRVAVDAVLDDGFGPFLLIEDESGWSRLDIDVGLVGDDYVELLTDLPVGTTVVVP